MLLTDVYQHRPVTWVGQVAIGSNCLKNYSGSLVTVSDLLGISLIDWLTSVIYCAELSIAIKNTTDGISTIIWKSYISIISNFNRVSLAFEAARWIPTFRSVYYIVNQSVRSVPLRTPKLKQHRLRWILGKLMSFVIVDSKIIRALGIIFWDNTWDIFSLIWLPFFII